MKKSVMFWNALGFIGQISLAIYSLEWFGVFEGILSIFVLFAAMGDELDDLPLCFQINIITVGGGAIALIGYLFYLLYKITVKPFNEWLDKPKRDIKELSTDNNINFHSIEEMNCPKCDMITAHELRGDELTNNATYWTCILCNYPLNP